ncbi:hypothetical protein GCM10010389_29640 [Streptomyces echinoruber]|uniref:Uncharacterized protein n=1 Tax=Streptomyces echinoruber TaxID=68898 RepID=A0A918RA64_9ACTN|nr:hypothetical protein GCM10010389_29640 [Streptomyces echinoruber]
MPAAAHSAGSSTRWTEAVDADSDAEDGANPKVTILPSATGPYGGQGRIPLNRTPQGSPDDHGSCAENRLQFFLSNVNAATSK